MVERSKHTEQKQERAITALLQAPSIREAAKQAGISETTLFRWLHKDEPFQEAYRKAKRELVQLAISHLQQSAGKAVGVLVEIAEDKKAPTPSRVSAAKAILELTVRAVEIEDVERRITTVEKFLEERNTQ